MVVHNLETYDKNLNIKIWKFDPKREETNSKLFQNYSKRFKMIKQDF